MMHSKEEWPRERCLKSGARALSMRELLSIILGDRALATRLLRHPVDGLAPEEVERTFFMHAAGLSTLASPGSERIRGLGEAQTARVLAMLEFARRYSVASTPHAVRQERLATSWDQAREAAFARVSPDWRLEEREWLGFVPVYRTPHGKLRVGGFCLVERGVRTHVNTDPTEIFARVLALRPTGIVLFHNHPSGDDRPSIPDEDLTRRVRQLAAPFGIELLGHGIVTSAPTPTWIS